MTTTVLLLVIAVGLSCLTFGMLLGYVLSRRVQQVSIRDIIRVQLENEGGEDDAR